MSDRCGKRVLSLNLHGLGDFILSMPVLSALSHKGCESLTSMVWPALAEFAGTVPFIDKVVPLPKDKENEPESSEFVRTICGPDGFDLVLDFSFLPRAAVMTKAAGGKRTMGFGIDREAFPWYTDSVPNLPDEHRLARNYHLLEILSIVPPDKPDFSIRTPARFRDRVEFLLAAHGIDWRRKPPIAIHPGSGAAKRNWPPERFAELADMLSFYTGQQVIILGGRERTYDGTDETETAARMEALMKSRAVNLAGQLSLPELAVLLSRSALFVGNNSGPAHLAASVARIPALLVWAPRNEKAWRPAGPQVKIVYAEALCQDQCLLNKCEKIRFCLSMISVEDVFASYLQNFTQDGAYTAAAGRKG